jgi:RNA polymerase sigma factor (sigma-70 family)
MGRFFEGKPANEHRGRRTYVSHPELTDRPSGNRRSLAGPQNGMQRAFHDRSRGALTIEMTVADGKSAPEITTNLHEKEIQEMTDVFIRCLPSFYAQALRWLGNPADAEDAVQDAYLSAHTHVNQFRRRTQMSTWLTLIVINSALMKLRRRPRQLPIPLDAPDREQEQQAFSDTIRDRQPNPEEICRGLELRQWLARLSERLSPTLCRTFQMRGVDGLRIRETAMRLGVPNGTVKGRVAKAPRSPQADGETKPRRRARCNFKSESRCCEHRQNYAIAVNTEVNMTASASRSGTGKPEPHRERGESGTFGRISVWNASC